MDTKTDSQVKRCDKSVLARRIVLIMIPLLEALVLVAIFSFKYGEFVTPGILWNDEGSYNALIKTYARFGGSPGYYGFNGVHAIIGTGSGWSPALIWPFSIPAMVIPVGMSYVFWMNIFYITLANLAFVLCVKPGRRESVYLSIVQLLSVVPILYLTTNMSEIFRFALSIAIAGLLLHMLREDRNKVVTYVIAPIVILYSVFAYIFFVFAVPIYVYFLMKDRKKVLSIPLSLGAMLITGGADYALIHFIICNYNIGKTERLFAHLSSGEFLSAAFDVCKMAKDGLLEIIYLKNYIAVNPIYPIHILILLFLFVICTAVCIRDIAKHEEGSRRYVCGAAAFALFIFTAGYATLYTIVPDTFLRGIEIVVVFALFMMSQSRSNIIKWATVALCAVSIMTLPKAIGTFTPDERFATKEVRSEWNELAERIGDAIEYRKDGTKWDNTVIMYTTEPRIVYALPSGVGINYSLTHETLCKEAGYLLFTKRKDGKPEWVDTDFDEFMNRYGDFIEENFAMIYDDGEYVIYRRSDI